MQPQDEIFTEVEVYAKAEGQGTGSTHNRGAFKAPIEAAIRRTPRAHLANIPKDDSLRSQNALEIERAIKQRNSAHNAIKGTSKQIEVQLAMIEEDIKEKKNHKGETFSQIKKSVSNLQDKIQDQQGDLNKIVGHLASMLKAFAHCDDI